jgi:23S rRNA (uracil-5-)-methyltransferase RumA
MVLGEAEQRGWKRKLLIDALERIGGLEEAHVDEMIAAPRPLGYRNRIELTLGRDAGGTRAIGYRTFDGGLVDVPACPVQHPLADRTLGVLRELLLADTSASGAARFDARPAYRILLRRSWATGRVLLVLREVGAPFPKATRLGKASMERAPELQGVVRLRARAGRRGGARAEPLLGDPFLEERIGEITFRLSAATFTQVHSQMASTLVRKVVEAAGDVRGQRVWDLYGGVGAFGLALARRGAVVTICDADPEAIVAGREAAASIGAKQVRFVREDVAAFLERQRGSAPPALVVANPPRTGLSRDARASLVGSAPERLILVSCDPATLARDLGPLRAGGLAVRRIVALDLFPQTAHVEAVVTLERGGPSS